MTCFQKRKKAVLTTSTFSPMQRSWNKNRVFITVLILILFFFLSLLWQEKLSLPPLCSLLIMFLRRRWRNQLENAQKANDDFIRSLFIVCCCDDVIIRMTWIEICSMYEEEGNERITKAPNQNEKYTTYSQWKIISPYFFCSDDTWQVFAPSTRHTLHKQDHELFVNNYFLPL